MYYKVIEMILNSREGEMAELSVSTIASKINVHPTLLSRKFKEYTKILLSEYIRNERIKKAEILLKSRNDLKIDDISRMVGFESKWYFRKIFREKNGVNPSVYRRIMNSKNF